MNQSLLIAVAVVGAIDVVILTIAAWDALTHPTDVDE